MSQPPKEKRAYALVQTKSGALRGRWRATPTPSCAFLGVPFAKPPVGDLRFAPPEAVEPWEGVRDALDYGPTASRTDDPNSLIPEPAIPGDSTLNVNVFTPSPGDEEAALPVLVWIHGGGFTGGSPSGPWYDGSTFNRDGIVNVSLSYRLGFVGFGWVEGAVQNRGVLDWLAGLQWVQDNIAAFGGDPENVTIAGQSAGGGAVLTLSGMAEAQHLFKNAMSISGALSDISVRDAKEFSKKIGKVLGVKPSKARLAGFSEAQILEAQEQVTSMKTPLDALRVLKGGLQLGPVIDGEVIKRPTLQSIALGVGGEKPLLVGAADDEFTMAFTEQMRFLQWLPKRMVLRAAGLKGGALSAYLNANPAVAKKGTAYLLGRLTTDTIFRSLVLRTAILRGDSPTWVYQFSYVQPQTELSIHCLDVPFWFDCLDSERVEKLAGPNPPQQLATVMHSAAAQFIKSGDPGWPRWTETRGEVEVFDEMPLTEIRTGGYDEVRPSLR